MDIARIQEALRRANLDGWLFFDHHERDPLSYRILGFRPKGHVTRRWYYLIPSDGEPRGLVHRIEAGIIDSLPGDKLKYSTWQEQHAAIKRLLAGLSRVAMQYSPMCALPYVAMVDAGTVELIRAHGVEVVSSAELIQEFEARLDEAQFEAHREAGRRVDRIRAEAFHFIGKKIAGGVDELTVRDWILGQFQREGLATDSGPIVAVNDHAGNPHYDPTKETNVPIREGDLVLLDTWAKLDQPRAVYYDITWAGVCGEPSEPVTKIFDIVRDARDRAISTVQKAIASKRDIRGFEVDDAARNHIRQCGLEKHFVHRTGHSIGEDVHGTGVNIDNFETQDDRRILPGALFSVEPGVYLNDFGIRSEVNVFVTPEKALVTGEVQRELVRIG